MFELTINNAVYQFNFGMGFLREVNKTVSVAVDGAPGVRKSVGLRYMLAGIIDGGVEALTDALDIANKGQNPRLTKAVLDAHIDDENTDIDQLFEDVMVFLESANATKKEMKTLLEAVAREKEKEEKAKAARENE